MDCFMERGLGPREYSTRVLLLLLCTRRNGHLLRTGHYPATRILANDGEERPAVMFTRKKKKAHEREEGTKEHEDRQDRDDKKKVRSLG